MFLRDARLNTARLLAGMAGLYLLAPASHAQTVPYPDLSRSIRQGGRGIAAMAKLSPDLATLTGQFSTARGARPDATYSAAQLASRFGIQGNARNPAVGLAISVAPGTDTRALTAAGATVYFQAGGTVYASAPVSALPALAALPGVRAVAPTKAASIPPLRLSPGGGPKISLPDVARGADALPVAFDHQGLTGKGVVVGVVDSGLDWRHPDFLRADGTTRIAALWDMTDDSFATSGGKIGGAPPADFQGKPLGTLYTRAQINAALAGKGTVNTADAEGHGTACAGTAAGNGRATGNGVPAGTFPGVAPEADLVIVRAGTDDGIGPLYYLGTRWIAQTAKALHEPCVISQSFGSQDNPHDGSEAEVAVMDDVAGPGKPGVAVCVAAGNDGLNSFHAGGRFGPRQAGQADIQSEQIELFVSKDTELDAYFSDTDDWGLAIVGLDNFLVTPDGKQDVAAIFKDGASVRANLQAPAAQPADFSRWFNAVGVDRTGGDREDRVAVPLPAGKYVVMGFGASAKVTDGAFDLYLPFTGDASFGHGTDKRYMVGSPGNAANVITVGAYNFRASWPSAAGGRTRHNLELGALSDYSSPGFRRGGLIKPEIAAPATFMISPLAAGSAMSKGDDGSPDTANITADGRHLAWAGTSAATPYVAGVVALMLQKNPTLDEVQIKGLLTKTATQDAFTGATPNIQWGYGKINPAAALAATPAK